MTTTAIRADAAADRADAAAADRAARLARVRSALHRAETATGVRPVDWVSGAPATSRLELVPPAAVPPLTPAPATPAPAAPSPAPAAPAPAPAPAAPELDGAWLPVPAALAPLLPHGAVRRGSVVEASGSTAVLLHLVAELAGREAWVVVVARPDLGLGAALAAGIDPDRLVLVPDPGPTAAAVLGALVDGFDVVVIGDCPALSARDRRAIAQRVRHRGAVLVSSSPWPSSTVRLCATERSSDGFATHGRLTSVGVVVDVTGRGDGRRRRAQLELTPAGMTAEPLSGDDPRAQSRWDVPADRMDTRREVG